MVSTRTFHGLANCHFHSPRLAVEGSSTTGGLEQRRRRRAPPSGSRTGDDQAPVPWSIPGRGGADG